MILDPVKALTELYCLWGCLSEPQPTYKSAMYTAQWTNNEHSNFTVIAFLGYCLAQWEVTVKFALVTVVHIDIERHGHLNNQTRSGRMINDA